MTIDESAYRTLPMNSTIWLPYDARLSLRMVTVVPSHWSRTSPEAK